jgi:hypothetical protein
LAKVRWYPITGLLLSALIACLGVARGADQKHTPALDAPAQDEAGPVITTLPPIIYVGDNFTVGGTGFTPASVVNFFVATSSGAVNYGPLVPGANLADSLITFVPTFVSQGEGVASVVVIDTDEGHIQSNAMLALLQGDAAEGLPSLTKINGVGLSPTSVDPGVALANIETVVSQGATVTLTGSGFDPVNGVGIDLFCDCPGGKIATIMLGPGDPGFATDSLTVTLPSAASGLATGPGAFRVTNMGNFFASAAVSVPIGAPIAISEVSQAGSTVTVTGAGFSDLTVINFFNLQAGEVVNLGGLNASGTALIPINLISDTEISFSVPAGAVSGPAYVQALNPPFIPFTSSGNASAGAFEVI